MTRSVVLLHIIRRPMSSLLAAGAVIGIAGAVASILTGNLYIGALGYVDATTMIMAGVLLLAGIARFRDDNDLTAFALPLIGALFTPPSSPPMGGKEGGGRIRISPWMALPIIILGALVLAIGLYPGPWLGWTADAGAHLLALGR